MNVTVFGSTGRTGRELVRAALDAGHTVTAAARDPSRIRVPHERLRAVRADVLDPPTLDAAVQGADAVVSALGEPDGRAPTVVYSTGVANILAAMHRAGIRRFVGVSALPVTPRAEVGFLEGRLVYPILYRLFGEGYADMARMEQVLHGSDVDWTIVRPPRLTDRPATGRYRKAVNQHIRRARSISRADLAGAMLDVLDDPHTVRATVGVSY